MVNPVDELAEALTAELDQRLAGADAALAEQFPGDSPDRSGNTHNSRIPESCGSNHPERDSPGNPESCGERTRTLGES